MSLAHRGSHAAQLARCPGRTWLFGRGQPLAFKIEARKTECKFISHTPMKSIEVISWFKPIDVHRTFQICRELEALRGSSGAMEHLNYSVCVSCPHHFGLQWGRGGEACIRLQDWPRLRCSDNNRAVMNANYVFSTSVYGNLFIDLDYKFWKLYMFNDFSPTLKGSVLFQPWLCLKSGHCWIHSDLAPWNQRMWWRKAWNVTSLTPELLMSFRRQAGKGKGGVWERLQPLAVFLP